MEEKEEKKKEATTKVNQSVSVSVLVAIIMILACLVVYLAMDKIGLFGGKLEGTVKEKTTEEGIQSVELSSTEAQELIKYVPVPMTPEWIDNAFLSKKVTPEEMDINHLMYNVMQRTTKNNNCTIEHMNANGLCDFTLKVEDVKVNLKSMYGDAISYLPNKVDGGSLWHCTLEGDVYACSNSGGGYCTGGPVDSYFKENNQIVKYQRAEKEYENLYVYVKYARVEVSAPSVGCERDLTTNEVTLQLYKYGTGTEKIIKNVLNGTDYYKANDTTPLSEKLYNQFGVQFTDYKLTYKIDGVHYTLVSVEPVE